MRLRSVARHSPAGLDLQGGGLLLGQTLFLCITFEIRRTYDTLPPQVGFCIQNFLCIIEMFLIGIAMHYAFHYTEWCAPSLPCSARTSTGGVRSVPVVCARVCVCVCEREGSAPFRPPASSRGGEWRLGNIQGRGSV